MMTREKVKELLPIIQAFIDGKKIQYRVTPIYRRHNYDFSYLKEWFDLDEDKCDGFCFDGTVNYRIKPESKYEPFKTKKECYDEMLKHQPFGWLIHKTKDINNSIGSITECNGFVYLSFATKENESFSAEFLFENYKFADGTPFGIKKS